MLKRAGAILPRLPFRRILPAPDGVIDALDRAVTAFSYPAMPFTGTPSGCTSFLLGSYQSRSNLLGSYDSRSDLEGSYQSRTDLAGSAC